MNYLNKFMVDFSARMRYNIFNKLPAYRFCKTEEEDKIINARYIQLIGRRKTK